MTITHTAAPTCSCGKPTRNGLTLCAGCTKTARIALENIADFHDDLDTVRTRQTRYGGTSSGGTATKGARPLGMDTRFAPGGRGTRAQDLTRTTIVRWTRIVLDNNPGVTPPLHDTLRACTAFLRRELGHITPRPDAPEFLAQITAAERALRIVIDRPADNGWYAGVCNAELAEHDATTCACACHLNEDGNCDVPGGCGINDTHVTCRRLLYADLGQTLIRCRDCGTTWDVAERREYLLHEARDHTATVEMIARIVLTLDARDPRNLSDRDVSVSKISARIRQWVSRGRIAPVPGAAVVIGGRHRPAYRVGEVLDLITEDTQTKTNTKIT